LLNSALTVRAHEAGSHAGWGWEALTDALITHVATNESPKVFMLWGAHAQRKRPLIEQAARGHLILQCNHPSPLSASRGETPFIGCGHFGLAQAWLQARAASPVGTLISTKFC
jgi:uracil-DNA glycosylase